MNRLSLKTHAARGFLAGTIGDILLKTSGFISTAIILAHVSPYQYGLWQLLLSISVAFGVVSVPSIAGMLVADLSREYGKKNDAYANNMLLHAAALFVFLGVLGALAMYFLASVVGAYTGINLVFLIQLLSLTLVSYACRQIYQLVFQSQLHLVHSQVSKVLERVGYLLGIVLFVSILGRGVDGIAYAFVAASFVPVLAYAPYVGLILRKAAIDWQPGTWKTFFSDLWVRGRWALLTDGANAATGSFWPWIAGYFLGVEVLGLISIALLAVGQVATSIPIQYVLRSVLPRTTGDMQLMHAWLLRAMRYSVWIYMVGGVLLVALFATVTPILFPLYAPALPYVAILILTLPLRGLGVIAGEYFFALGLQQSLFFVSTVPKLAMLAVLPVFLYVGGLVGFLAWQVLNADIVVYFRLRAIRARDQQAIPITSLFMPEHIDVVFIEKILDMVKKRLKGLVA
ncbi:MAG: hypothetical protein KBE09_01680 [Candidatus Pacebacteria bacterium]|nr:hypothetical protein [Candidatus Paceibacterota bacterium]